MKHLFTLIFLGIIINTIACCAAGQYRVFPLGESKGKLIVAEFRLSRYCQNGDGMGEENQFRYAGVANLGYFNGDSVTLIRVVDSFNITACVCDFKTFTEKTEMVEKLLPFYKNTLREARKMAAFKEAKPISYVYHDNNEEIDGMEFRNDTLPSLYVDNHPVELYPTNWAACGFLARIMEVRTYQVLDKTYTIITLTCDYKHQMPELKIKENQERFKSIETGFTYCVTTFHGLNRDYIIEK